MKSFLSNVDASQYFTGLRGDDGMPWKTKDDSEYRFPYKVSGKITREIAGPLRRRAFSMKDCVIPDKETAVPSRSSGFPVGKTGLPSKEFAIPGKENAVPSSEYGIPDKENGLPAKEFRFPG